MLALDGAFDQRVFQLKRGGGLTAGTLRQGLCLGRVPSRNVGKSVVTDLAFANQSAQCINNFRGWGDCVPDMHPVQIDVVHFEPTQRRLQRPINILAAVAAGVRVAFLRVERVFCCDYELVAQSGVDHELAQQLLRLALDINICTVHNIAAISDIAIKYGAGGSVVRAPAIVGEGHGAQGERTDAQPGAA